MASESGSSTDSHAETPEKDGEAPHGGFIYRVKAEMLSKRQSRHSFVLVVFASAVKKKYGAGLKFSNLMNIGKKKPSALESPEKCLDTSGKQRAITPISQNIMTSRGE